MKSKAMILIVSLLSMSMIALAQENRIARPEMKTSDLQALIDQVSSKGGGRITFPKGEYHTGQLELKTGVELHLEEGAVILGSTSPHLI